MNSDNKLLNAAFKYVSFGWKIFPLHNVKDDICSCGNTKCENPAKHPRTRHGVKEASSDLETVKKWWTTWSDANIGIATGEASGFFGLDVDPDKGGDESLEKLEDENGKLPNTVESLTGGDGRHLLFNYPQFKKIKNAVSLLPGLDIRGDNGYIVAPESTHISGKKYEWEISSHPDEVPIAEAPEWLIKIITDRPSKNHPGPALSTIEVLEGVPDGCRNESIWRLSGRFKCAGIPEDAALKLLLEAAANCKPPFNPEKVHEMVKRQYSAVEANLISHNSLISPSLSSNKYPKPLESAAYYGLAGDIVRAIEPHSEADPAALLIQFLVVFGNIIGRKTYFIAEGSRHYTNLFVVLVGETSQGKKGSSWSQIKRIFETIDPNWLLNNNPSGLSSGEGLIWAVRNPIEKKDPIRDKEKKIVSYQPLLVDEGIADKRLLVLEAEFASTLRVLGREGNTLSPLIRNAWDCGNLQSLTKNSPAKATEAHISIIGHITKDELKRYLDRTETGNGFANRFLFLCVKRSKYLPQGGKLHEVNFAPLLARLRTAIQFANVVREIERDEHANKLWNERYRLLVDKGPGLFGALTARAISQVMRIASIFSLLDCSDKIKCEHLEAAMLFQDYVERSVAYVFEDALGDPIADTILTALRNELPDGLTLTQTSDLFHHHKTNRVQACIQNLIAMKLVEVSLIETGGRSAQLLKATIAEKAN